MRLPAKSGYLSAVIVLVAVVLVASFMGYLLTTMHIDDQAVDIVKAEVVRLEKNNPAAQAITLTSFEHCPGEKGIAVRVGYTLGKQADDPSGVRYFILRKPVFGGWYIAYESKEDAYSEYAQKGNGPTKRF